MSNVKRVLALILAALLMISMAACGGDTDKTTEAEKTTQAGTEKKETTEVEKKESDVKTKATISRDADGNYTGPLCEEKTTLSIFTFGPGDFTSGTFSQEVIDNNPAYKLLEEATNIDIDFVVPASSDLTNQFNLMVTSGNYTDIICMGGSTVYPGGIDQALEDGAFFDMTDYAEEWLPNYYKVLTENEQAYKECTTLNNKIGAVCMIYDPEVPGKVLQWWGQIIRKDILDKHNMDIPETVDEWEAALRVLKEEGFDVPYTMINASGLDSSFLAAFGIVACPLSRFNTSTALFYPIDGKMTWGAVEDGMKEYLTMMNRWYADGLIDPEFMTRCWMTTMDTIYAMYGNSEIGACFIGDAGLPSYTAPLLAVNPDAETVACPVPTMEKGKTTVVEAGNLYNYSLKKFVISNKCEDPFLAMAFIDYLCSPNGRLLTNFGVEGVSYNMEDDGPVYSENILKAEDGALAAMKLNAANSLVVMAWESRRNLQYKQPEVIELGNVWTSTCEQQTIIYAMTSQETLDAEAKMSDIKTFFAESVISAIISAEGLANWDNVVQQIWDMGLQDVLDIYQAGYDRYNNR